MNLPDYNFISAPLWVITLLHIITLSLHYLAMNMMVGGVIIVLFANINNKWHNQDVHRLIKLFPTAMAATVSFGVAPLLFVQLVYGSLIYAASIVSGWFWLMIAATVIISYYMLYASAFAKKENALRSSIFLLVALAGFIYITFIFTSVFSMAERPELIKALYKNNQSGLVINPDIGSYLFRWLHMLTGALAVGSFMAGWINRKSKEFFDISRKFYLFGIAAAMIMGISYLFTFGEYLIPFVSSYMASILVVSIVMSLLSLYYYFRMQFLPSGLSLLISFVGMVTIRHNVRLMRLKGFFDPETIPVKLQMPVFFLFVIFFIIAVITLWYMMKIFFKEREVS